MFWNGDGSETGEPEGAEPEGGIIKRRDQNPEQWQATIARSQASQLTSQVTTQNKMAKKGKRGRTGGDGNHLVTTNNNADAHTGGFPPHLVEACKPPRRRDAQGRQRPPPSPPEVMELYPRHVYASRNFLSPSECQMWIQAAEHSVGGGGGFGVGGGGGGADLRRRV